MSDPIIPDWARDLQPASRSTPPETLVDCEAPDERRKIQRDPKPVPAKRGRPRKVLEEPEEEATDENFEPEIVDGIPMPRVFSQKLRAMSPEERAQWDADRYRAKTDQIFLAREILGLDVVENPHAALFNLCLHKQPGVPLNQLSPIKRRMILWPRGHAKTVCTRVEMVQCILNYPNIRICFLSGSDSLSMLQLAALKQVFEKPTPEFLRLFPEMCLTSRQSKKKVWTDHLDSLGTQHAFSVPCRTSQVAAEPTFSISTSKKVKAGSHFDLFFVDDIVNEQNYRNAAQLEKCYQDYLSLIPLLEPTGFLAVTGTRYSFGDTYERLAEMAQREGGANRWILSIRDCYSQGNCKTCGHAEVFHDRDQNVAQPPCTAKGCACKGFVSNGDLNAVLFPQVIKRDGNPFGFTREILENIRAEIGNQNFSNQYLNNPIDVSEQMFTSAMIGKATIFDQKLLPTYGAAGVYLVGDLAYSSENSDGDRDLSVIYVVQQFRGQIFITDCRFGRWSSNALVEETLKLMMEKRPNTIYFEKPAGPADALHNLLLARANQAGIAKMPLQWVKVSNAKDAKSIRINNLQAILGQRLFLFAGMPGYDQLVSQMEKWPRLGKHDDFLDALSRCPEVSTSWAHDTPPQPQTVANWLQKLQGTTTIEEDYPTGACGTGICC